MCSDRKTVGFEVHGSFHEDRLRSSHFRHRWNDYRYLHFSLLFSSLLLPSIPCSHLHKSPTLTADHGFISSPISFSIHALTWSTFHNSLHSSQLHISIIISCYFSITTHKTFHSSVPHLHYRCSLSVGYHTKIGRLIRYRFLPFFSFSIINDSRCANTHLTPKLKFYLNGGVARIVDISNTMPSTDPFKRLSLLAEAH